jgi:hypothetical protein
LCPCELVGRHFKLVGRRFKLESCPNELAKRRFEPGTTLGTHESCLFELESSLCELESSLCELESCLFKLEL